MREDGFSLIELLVALSIISVFGCLAYPAYTRYWVQLKRIEARSALLEGRLMLEKYAMAHQGYQGAHLENLGLSSQTKKGHYSFQLEVIDDRQYQLIAKPTFKDTVCSELSCNAQNQRFYKGSGSYHDCWGD